MPLGVGARDDASPSLAQQGDQTVNKSTDGDERPLPIECQAWWHLGHPPGRDFISSAFIERMAFLQEFHERIPAAVGVQEPQRTSYT